MCKLIEPILHSKYPAITQDEQEISIPLQLLCLAIFDAILVHMLNTVCVYVCVYIYVCSIHVFMCVCIGRNFYTVAAFVSSYSTHMLNMVCICAYNVYTCMYVCVHVFFTHTCNSLCLATFDTMHLKTHMHTYKADATHINTHMLTHIGRLNCFLSAKVVFM